MRLVIRPIRYTARTDAMHAWARALGLVTLLDTGAWIVLGAGRGRLALHEVPDGDPSAGTTTLAVETDDLDALERMWSAAGLATRRVDAHGHPLLFAATPFGGEIAAGVLSPSDGGDAADPDLTVMPMLVSDEVETTADWFVRTLGLRLRITSERGGWADLAVPDDGGLVAIHHRDDLASEPPRQAGSADMPEIGVGLTFEHADVDALLERVRSAGLQDAHVVDEAYNRTLLVRCPDGDEIWVNGAITDLYGYRTG